MQAVKLSLIVLMALPVAALAQDASPQARSGQDQSAQDSSASAQDESAQGESTQGRSQLAEGESSSSCISNITFSQEFLSRYPTAGGACREVKVQDGHKWARFDANVARVSGNRVTANFVDRFDKNLGSITFDAAPEARVQVNGRPMRFSTLQRGDRLSFWMPEDRVGFYAEPGASETTKLAVVSTEPAQR